MSYVSLLRTVPGLLSQPTGIAAIASVGIHGAIAFILPLVPLDSDSAKEGKNLKTVGIVELNQADQQRLPQTNPSSTPLQALPPFPVQPGTGALPSFAQQNTPLPTPPVASAPPSSTSLFLPPLNQSSQGLGVPRFPSNSNSASTSSQKFFPNFNPNAGVRIGTPKSTAKKPNVRGNRNYRIARGNQFGSRGLPTLQPGNLPGGLPNNPAPINPNQAEFSRLPQGPQGVTPPPEVPANSQATNRNRQLVAPVARVPKADGNFTLARGSQFSAKSPNSSYRWSNLQRGNFKGNSGQKVLSEGELFAKAREEFPQVETQLKPLTAKLNAAQAGKQTNVKGALVVDGDGKINFFKLLDSSVPSNLQLAVRKYFNQYFQKNPVKANGKPKYYSFNVALGPNSSNSVVRPQGSNGSVRSSESLSERLQSIRNSRSSVSTPSVNQNDPKKPSSNQQNLNSKPQKLPKLNIIREKPKSSTSQIEVKKPSRPVSNIKIPVQVPVVKPTPGIVEKKPASKPIIVNTKPQQSIRKTKPKTSSNNSVNIQKPSSSRKATLTQRLRNGNNSTSKKPNSTLIKKLRQVKQERQKSE
ncbi:MAG: hypothetical protein AAF208_02330 [Cyanobacteria bacterium P01_A01_bin.45]